MKLLARLEKQKSTWFLIFISFLFFLFRLPSVFEPYWYGDEGIYEVIGMALRQGRHLYSGIWDNKPPLLYVIYALFNGDQPAVRIFSLLFGLASVITLFYLSKKLFQKQNTQFIVTGIFAFLFATPFLEGNIANAENFMVFPILLAALLLINVGVGSRTGARPTPTRWNTLFSLFIAGLLLGLAFLIKIVAVFDFGAFFVFLFFITYKNKSNVIPIGSNKNNGIASLFDKLRVRNDVVKCLFTFTVGFILPIVVTFLFFFIQGDLKTFIVSAFLSNVGYVEYGNRFFVPHGLLILKLLLLLIFIVFLFFKRKTISSIHLFIFLWVAFSLFDAFFSQRPYTHYVLTFITSFSLYIGLCITSKKSQWMSILAGIILVLIMSSGFSLHQRVYKYLFGYYGNFLAFTLQEKSMHSYLSFFDSATPVNYELSSFIAAHGKDTGLFIWGNDAQIYKLTNMLPPGRFIVTYHMVSSKQNLEETGAALAQAKPKYILLLPKQSVIPYSLIQYEPKITINDATIYEKVF